MFTHFNSFRCAKLIITRQLLGNALHLSISGSLLVQFHLSLLARSVRGLSPQPICLRIWKASRNIKETNWYLYFVHLELYQRPANTTSCRVNHTAYLILVIAPSFLLDYWCPLWLQSQMMNSRLTLDRHVFRAQVYFEMLCLRAVLKSNINKHSHTHTKQAHCSYTHVDLKCLSWIRCWIIHQKTWFKDIKKHKAIPWPSCIATCYRTINGYINVIHNSFILLYAPHTENRFTAPEQMTMV